MTSAETDAPTPPRPLRLWPAVVIVMLQWLAWYGAPIVAPGASILWGWSAALACGVGVIA